MTTASSQNTAEHTTMRQAILDEIAQDVPQRFVERIHPLLRLAIPVLLMSGVLSTGDAPTYYAFSVVIIIASALFGVFSVFWPRFWKIGTTIAVFTLFVRAFFEYGDSVLFHVGPLTVTQEGVDSAIWYIAMLLAVCAPLILLSSILSLKDMAQALETMGASRQASYVVMNAQVPSKMLNDHAGSKWMEVVGFAYARYFQRCLRWFFLLSQALKNAQLQWKFAVLVSQKIHSFSNLTKSSLLGTLFIYLSLCLYQQPLLWEVDSYGERNKRH